MCVCVCVCECGDEVVCVSAAMRSVRECGDEGCARVVERTCRGVREGDWRARLTTITRVQSRGMVPRC